MMIKLSGGWVSDGHVQTIVPNKDDGGCVVRLLDGKIKLGESADEVAAKANKVRAALAVLRIKNFEDLDGAINLLLYGLAARPGTKEDDDETL